MAKDWLKFKRYSHLTPRISHKDERWVRKYVAHPENIKNHRFFPMLHYTLVENRYRRPKQNGIRSEFRQEKKKSREIFYSNHLDGHVYSFYANKLSGLLNSQYELDSSLMDSVIAYRSIPFNDSRNKCNIDFAHEVFNFIKTNKENALTAICLDVSSYFDSIDHKLLKKAWTRLLNRSDLPLDHYKVYKSITKFSYIEISDIFKITPHHKIEKMLYLKNMSIDGFFKSSEEFRKLIEGKNIIRVNRSAVGIPQGSPMSAVLSNLYLLEFDQLMVKLAKQYNGLYRRYSDDIVFVCNPNWIDRVDKSVKNFLTTSLKLSVQDKKTQRVEFQREVKSGEWKTTLNEQGYKYKGRPLTYLGFDFDGQNIRIKQKSISSYYRKTKRMIRRAAYFAKRTNEAQLKGRAKNKDSWIYRSKIYRLKTHLGAKKKKVSNKVFWGNFLSYVYNASSIMDEPGIKKQLRNHWNLVEGEINRLSLKYGLPKSSKKSRHDQSVDNGRNDVEMKSAHSQ